MQTRKTSIQFWILHILSLVGVTLSIYLVQHFYEIRNGTASGFNSICNVAEKMNCDVVTASSYAELIPGFPLAAFAAGWFLALFIVSLIGHLSQAEIRKREAIRACFGLALTGTLAGIPTFLIMAFQLKTYCLFCLGIDLISVTSLITALTLKPKRPSAGRPNFREWGILTGTILVALVISVFGLKILDTGRISADEAHNAAQQLLAHPVLPMINRDGDLQALSFGPKNAPIQIVEFSDFQCPHCQAAALALNAVLHEFADQIHVEFRNFPLDQSCNPDIQFTPHPAACAAAKAAICAHQQGQFEPAYQELFEKQEQLQRKTPIDIVISGKNGSALDRKKLEDCVQAPETLTTLSKDLSEGKLMGVRATPTFFVNGHKIEGALATPVWRKMIGQLLQK